MSREKYKVVPFPKFRNTAIDAGRLARNKHVMHALIEIDVTAPSSIINDHYKRKNKRISFTAFIIHCLGKAIDQFPTLHAYLNWRRKLIIFDEINIGAMIEVKREGIGVPMPHIFKNVQRRTVMNINDELRDVQIDSGSYDGSKYINRFLKLPWFIRQILYWWILKVPQSFRHISSTVVVTSIGMFGKITGWGIPKPSLTLTITVGSIIKKPVVVEDEIKIRDILHLTISVNHDIVDGAPATRFVNFLKSLIEKGEGLEEFNTQSEATKPILN